MAQMSEAFKLTKYLSVIIIIIIIYTIIIYTFV